MNAPARRVLDVSLLPEGGFGHRCLTWWGTFGIIAIEGTMFALVIGGYFYLAGRSPTWPPPGIAPPALQWGTATLIVLLASAIPNELARRASHRIDLHGVRLWLIVCTVLGVIANGTRAMEFTALNVTWSDNSYGSVVWTLLGLHTIHIATDVYDTIVLIVLMFIGPIEERRFTDVEDNAVYWYFVVAIYVAIFGVIYWASRLI